METAELFTDKTEGVAESLKGTIDAMEARIGRLLNASEVELVLYLNTVRVMRMRAREIPKGFHYWGTEDFLLQHGQWFTPAPRPKWLDKQENRMCFRNSIIQTIHRGLQYVEGFANSIIPTHHAWNTDSRRRLIDCTWAEPGTAYLGVIFPKRMAVKTVALDGSAMLDDYQNGFPLYRKPWKERKRTVAAPY